MQHDVQTRQDAVLREVSGQFIQGKRHAQRRGASIKLSKVV
jgi:hypothetical protein